MSDLADGRTEDQRHAPGRVGAKYAVGEKDGASCRRREGGEEDEEEEKKLAAEEEAVGDWDESDSGS